MWKAKILESNTEDALTQLLEILNQKKLSRDDFCVIESSLNNIVFLYQEPKELSDLPYLMLCQEDLLRDKW